ncbi:MAG: hypothetical protein ABJH98_15015 [Reichenbachiella sp.]
MIFSKNSESLIMKHFSLTLILSLQLLLCFGNGSVKIEFSPGVDGDYDLFLKEAFEKASYNAFVSYSNEKETRDYDFRVTYSKEKKSIKVLLFNRENELIKQSKQQVARLKSWKSVEAAVSEFFNQEIDISEGKQKSPPDFNASVKVSKIDSATYLITSQGAAASSINSVEEDFFRISDFLLSSYNFYFENSNYHYQTGSGLAVYDHVGKQTMGIVIGVKGNEESKKLKELPKQFQNYFSKKIDHPILVTDSSVEANRSSTGIILFRSTGYSFSARDFKIFIDGQLKCSLTNKSYVYLPLNEGVYFLTVQLGGKKVKAGTKSIRVDVIQNEISYLESMFADGFGAVVTQEVEELNASRLKSDLNNQVGCE